MSGVATPPVIVKPFGASAGAGFITNPIPVAAGDPGAASYDEGFPPICFAELTSGGIPPSGADFNGILRAATAFCALLQAGQLVPFSSTAATAFTGYKVGARLQSTTPGLTWTNYLDGNTADPDSDSTHWAANVPLFLTTTPAAGTFNNVALPGPSDFVWDVDTTAGDVAFTGFIAQRDGQRIYLNNTGANLLSVDALNGGSTAPRQIRSATDLTLIQLQTLTLQYAAGAPGGGKWLLI